MARLGRVGFLAIAVVFHLMYLWSIFDIYFVSPIVSGMREYRVERADGAPAPAKRLVLFVGDGLRADKAFQSFPDPSPENPSKPDLTPKPLAPFLRSRVLTHGTFGVSHTRVPTESRPGHVALIAGLYEDVSSVTTGWKMNPVNFDSVFNRSRHTWSWGSPDILPMFKEGAVPGRIDADTYGAEFEDFTQDSTQLDTWVFERVKALFTSAKTNSTLDAALRKDKNVFFLHLLGLDTTGHSYRPYSKEYLHNIKIVDQGVQEITKIVDDFYDDGKTAFVFTADHGMSDWGSHGDGHPDNTRTPLVVWGSGVARPRIWKQGKAPGHEDGFSADWNLDHVQRHDVAQADIAALMAYLAGLDFPVNSVGELPLSYLATDKKDKALGALANTQAVLEMYRVKEKEKRATKLRYRSYGPFSDEQHSVESRIEYLRNLIADGSYDESIAQASELLHLCLEGLRYLQTYDWLFLRTMVTLGYLGWVAFALTTVVDLHILHGKSEAQRTTSSTIFFSSVLIGLYSLLWVEHSSWTYYAYGIFPIAFWEEVVARRQALIAGKNALFGTINSAGSYASFLVQAFAFIGLLEALVQSYFHRQIYTICFVLAATWPAFYGWAFVEQNKLLTGSWAGGCLVMSTFTLLPVIKVEDANTITLGGLLSFSAGILYLLFEKRITTSSSPTKSKRLSANSLSRTIMGAQVGLILLSILVTRSSVASLQAKRGLPLGNQVAGWLILLTSLSLPFAHRLQPNSDYLHRLVVIFLTFSPLFVILTISYEGLFYFAFCTTLLTWVRLEHRVHLFTRNTPAPSTLSAEFDAVTPLLEATEGRLKLIGKEGYRALTLSDARIALFFFFLLQAAFFCTGNIASVSSFSLESVYRLIPVFDPFSQGALLTLKLMIPFAVISANLGILNRRLGVAPSALFMVVMAISDIMTLNFFYMVRDEGSWLDIGTTISHFCIASLLCVFVAGLEFVSESFISGVDVDDEDDKHSSSLMSERNGKSRHVNGKAMTANGKVNGDLHKGSGIGD